MSDVFLSYSRKNHKLTKDLAGNLRSRDLDVWVDLDGIYAGEEFWPQICSAIEGADTFVFVMTPDSVKSEFCLREIEHAVGFNKRVLPLKALECDDEDIPKDLRSRQWTLVGEDGDLESASDALAQAVRTDAEWVRSHTRLLVRAREWSARQRDKGTLLRGGVLQEAERWLAEGIDKEPRPTALHSEFLLASRKAATNRQRQALGLVTAALVVTIGLALFALYQRSEAIDQRDTAVSRELATRSLMELDVDPSRSAFLALESASVKPTEESEQALRQSLLNLHLRGTLDGHSEWVTGAVFSRDGQLIATTSGDLTARIWDADTTESRQTLEGHTGTIWRSEFDREGTRLLTVGDRSARIWSVETGEMLFELSHRDFVIDADWNEAGDRVVTASHDNTARIWDAETGTPLFDLRGHDADLTWVAFSPDGSKVVTSSADGTAAVWASSTGALEARLEGHTDQVVMAVFSPDGTRVATAGWDATAAVWDASTGRRLADYRGHREPLTSVAFSPDGDSVVTASRDGTAHVWRAETGETIAELRGHTSRVNSARFSPDGQWIVTASNDQTARVWEAMTPGGEFNLDPSVFFAQTGQALWRTMAVLRGHQGEVVQAEFSPDSRFVVTASADRTAKIWRPELWRPTTRIDWESEVSDAEPVAFSPRSRLVRVNEGIWEVETGRFVAKGNVCFGDADDFVLVSSDGRTEVRLPPSWDVERELPGDDCAVSPDGEWLATTLDGQTRVWNRRTWSQVAALTGEDPSFAPNGSLVTTDGQTYLWSARTWSLTRKLFGTLGHVSSGGDWLATEAGTFLDFTMLWDAESGAYLSELPSDARTFSPDGRWAAAVTSNRLRVLDVRTGVPVFEVEPTREQIGISFVGGFTEAEFSPGGRFLIAGSDRGWAYVWETRTWRRLAVLRGEGSVDGVAISPTEGVAATASEDKIARLWDLTSGQMMVPLRGHSDWVRSVAFSPDGQRVVTAGLDGSAQVYRCEACGRLEDLVLLTGERTEGLTDAVEQEESAQLAQETISRARELAADGDLEEATRLLEIALTLDPALRFDARAEAERIGFDSLVQVGELQAKAGRIEASLRSLRQAKRIRPDSSLDPEVRAVEIGVGSLVRIGRVLAEAGDSEEAIAYFEDALKWDPNLGLVPAQEVGRAQSRNARSEGENLAREGEEVAAIEKFREAVELDPELELDPESEARRIVLESVTVRLNQLLQANRAAEALSVYGDLDPSVQLSADLLNGLCWEGGLSGNAALARPACETAVQLEPGNWQYLDSRGLVRALLGDFDGAIADFEAYILNESSEQGRAMRESWVEALRDGRNPFTTEVIESLKNPFLFF